MYRLSKSRLLSALQCQKRLYLEIHQPDAAQPDEGLQTRFAIGQQAGEVARTLFPGGILVGHSEDVTAALQETGALLAGTGDLILFEPAFQHDGVVIRADILIRRNGRYRLLEVKSATQVYDYHFHDAAIQAWVMEGASYPIERGSILHIDADFVYAGDGDYRRLFTEVDVTNAIAALKPKVPELVQRSRAVLGGPMPDIPVGDQCGDPFACPFLGYCDRDAPEFPMSLLSRHWRLRDQLVAEGFRDIRDVPIDRIDPPLLQRIWRATTSGRPELDAGAADVIRGLGYPRYFLDFETIQFAVPIWAGTSPYRQLPFQWSCHVRAPDGALKHVEFLDASGQAPMRSFAESLIGALGPTGPIVVYSGFEGGVLRALSERFPDLSAPLEAIRDRLFDLLPVVRQHYYHPAMKGSWSIKTLLPTIAPELGFDDLEEVRDGVAAQTAFLEILGAGTTPERRAQLTQALRAYCQRDTLAMVRVAEFLAHNRAGVDSA